MPFQCRQYEMHDYVSNKFKGVILLAKRNNLLIFILTIGVFGILNTEMGYIGILPSIAEHFNVSVSTAGLLVSLFALAVAISGPILPLLLSRINRKTIMLIVLGVFLSGNIVAIFTSNFTTLLVARIIPAFFHPVYCSLAFSVAAASVSREEAPKAVAKVFIGVSAGMVIGVPVSSFIDSVFSLQAAMAFFAVVIAISFIATILFVPSMPVEEKISYGTQLTILKKLITWLSIAAVILLNAAIFGVYSYLADYLGTVTNMAPNTISLTLFLYGGANVIGSMIAGRLLTKNATRLVLMYPLALGAIYIILFFTGHFTLPMLIISLVWGIFGGIGANITQYWIMSAAPNSPDFSNGLFLTAANLGTTFGTAVGGIFISQMGIRYVVIVGILSVILSLAMILLRIFIYNPSKKLDAR